MFRRSTKSPGFAAPPHDARHASPILTLIAIVALAPLYCHCVDRQRRTPAQLF